MEIEQNGLPNEMGFGSVGQGGQGGRVRRYSVEQDFRENKYKVNRKKEKGPQKNLEGDRNVTANIQTGAKDPLLKLPKIYSTYFSMVELRNKVNALKQKFAALMNKGVEQETLQQLVGQMQECCDRGLVIQKELNSLSLQYGYLPSQKTNLRKRLKKTQKAWKLVAQQLRELRKLGDCLQSNLSNSKEQSGLIASISAILGALGAVGSGAAAAMTAGMKCVEVGSAAYGITTTCGLTLTATPIGCAIACLGCCALAIKGVISLCRKHK